VIEKKPKYNLPEIANVCNMRAIIIIMQSKIFTQHKNFPEKNSYPTNNDAKITRKTTIFCYVTVHVHVYLYIIPIGGAVYRYSLRVRGHNNTWTMHQPIISAIILAARHAID
jgi:hypothetical protein